MKRQAGSAADSSLHPMHQPPFSALVDNEFAARAL